MNDFGNIFDGECPAFDRVNPLRAEALKHMLEIPIFLLGRSHIHTLSTRGQFRGEN